MLIIQHGRQAVISIVMSLKINKRLPLYTRMVLLRFHVDIQSQTKVRFRIPNDPIRPPCGHFENGVAENQEASVYAHNQNAHKISNWSTKETLTYAAETMSPTDGQTADNVNPVYPLQRRWAGV